MVMILILPIHIGHVCTVSVVGMIQSLLSYGIKLQSHLTDINPGEVVKTSVIKLIADSSKILVFITNDWKREELFQFEMELLKQRTIGEVVVVTVDVEEHALTQGLPECIVNIIRENNHFTYPGDQCLSSSTNCNAFAQLLIEKLKGTK